MKLTINPRKILKLLLLVAVALLAINIALQALKFSGLYLGNLTPRFDFDQEISVPTWFSQSLLLLAAGLFWHIATLAHKAKNKFHRHWLGLAIVFLLLSIDEGSMLHEAAIDPLKNVLGIQGGIFYFAWVLPAMFLLILFVAVYLRFWLELEPRLRNLFLLAGSIYVAGALGVEMVGGWYATTHGDGFMYQVIIAGEEFLEMLGAIILVYALSGKIKDLTGGKLLF